jgi:hypothetical protein
MSLEIDLLVSFQAKLCRFSLTKHITEKYELLSLEFGAGVSNSHINYNDEVLHTEQRTPVKKSTVTLLVPPAC